MHSNTVLLTLVMAGMALVPFAVVTLTCFSKIAVVLSFARSALGMQQAPPNIVLTGLAVVLSGYIMAPVLSQTATLSQGVETAFATHQNLFSSLSTMAEPLRQFLVKHSSDEERQKLLEWRAEIQPSGSDASVTDLDLAIVVPAFLLTELKEAFQIGFLLFLPFLILDMVIANVLLALGMQTLAPSQVSLPLKLILFVAVDGWSLLARGLILGYR